MVRKATLLGAAIAAIVLTVSSSAFALPTMIRLGYADCAACHISPQGGGPLNEYGKGIDQAQSLRGGEYKTKEEGLGRAFTFNGRVAQDLRTVIYDQKTFTDNQPTVDLFRPRLMYRNVTNVGGGFRVAGTVTLESVHAPRPNLKYDPTTQTPNVFVNTALVHYKANDTVELAAGRDMLPTGVFTPDMSLYTKARNHWGNYDAPTQVKLFVNAKRYHITPFAYAPGGYEAKGEAETGAGTLAEFDLLGKGRTVVGTTLLHGSSDNGNRRMIGAYTRLGFGRWGIFAEHDVTDRTREGAAVPVASAFTQQATYGQVFFYVREWLMASGIAERLRVQAPFTERLNAGRFELSARLASQATLSLSTRVQRNEVTGRVNKGLVLQAAFKTVN